MLLLGWLVLAVIVYTIYRVRRGSRPA
jgi:hypothetical protein